MCSGRIWALGAILSLWQSGEARSVVKKLQEPWNGGPRNVEAIECKSWCGFHPFHFSSVWLMRLCFNFTTLFKENLLLSRLTSRSRVGSRSWMGRAEGGQAWRRCRVWSPVSPEIHQKRHYRMWVGGQTMAQKQSCQTQGWKVGVEGMVRRCPRPWRTAWGLDIALGGGVGGAAEPANLVRGLLMIDPHR